MPNAAAAAGPPAAVDVAERPPTDLRLVPVAVVVWAVAWGTPVAPAGARAAAGLMAAVAVLGLLWTQRSRWIGRPPGGPPRSDRPGPRPRESEDAGGDGAAGGPASALGRRGPGAGAVWMLIACLVAGSAAGFAAEVRIRAQHAGPLPALVEQRAVVAVQVRVTGYPRVYTARARHGPARPTVAVPVRVERVLGRGRASRIRSPVLLHSTDLTWRRVVPGERYAANGRLAPPGPHGGPPALWVARFSSRLEPASWAHRWAAAVRADLHAAVAGLPSGPRALVPGLVVGDTSAVDPEDTAAFKVAGLTHLTAVSGANVAILLAVALGMAGGVGVPRRLRPLLGGATVVGFLLVVGPAPSLLRAAVMGGVGLLALALGRPARAVPALCSAVVLLLLADPALARSCSFALSTVATASLIGLAPRWRDRLADHMPRPLATAVAVPAAAQVACAPLIVLLSGTISLVAVVANLLVAPVVAPAMICGLLAAAAQPLSPDLAGVLARPAGLCAAWILTVARHCAALPGATLPWPDGRRGALLLAGLTTLALLLIDRRKSAVPAHSRAAGTPGPAGPAGAAGAAGAVGPAGAAGATRVSGTRRRRGLVAALALLVGALLVRPTLPVPTALRPSMWPPPGWQLVACDVGQGDGLVLAVAPGTGVVVDTGPDPATMDRCLRRLGIRVIPTVLLTHFHADHVEGLPGALRGRHVGRIEVSPLDDPPGEAARVNRWAAAAGVPVERARPGEVRQIGGLRWRVLWPTTLLAGDSPPNNASVVLLAVTPAGLSLLLAGDVEPLAQAVLHQQEPDLRADVLKVPHHGSAYQDDDFLRSVRAKVALVSVGADNDYGHPAARTLELLRSTGATALRTDTGGDLAVAVQHGELRAAARSGSGGGPGREPGQPGTAPHQQRRRRRALSDVASETLTGRGRSPSRAVPGGSRAPRLAA